MLRRWIIRICFILPLVICLLAWAWSTQHRTEITYARSRLRLPKPTMTTCGLIWGEILVRREDGIAHGQDGWSVSANAVPFHIMYPDLIGPSRNLFLGFYYGRTSLFSTHVCVPLWFPILVFSALLIPVWRKTRPKLNLKTAFPVEVGKHND